MDQKSLHQSKTANQNNQQPTMDKLSHKEKSVAIKQTYEERAKELIASFAGTPLEGFTFVEANNNGVLIQKGRMVRIVCFDKTLNAHMNRTLPYEWPENLPVTIKNASNLQKKHINWYFIGEKENRQMINDFNLS